MPVTWWQYGLYGLMSPVPTWWFGWRTIALVIVLSVFVRYILKYFKPTQQLPQQQLETTQDRMNSLEETKTIEQLTRLIIEWSWYTDHSVSLWATLCRLQESSLRKDHRSYLQQLEYTLYDPAYEIKISLEQAKNYLINHDLLGTSPNA